MQASKKDKLFNKIAVQSGLKLSDEDISTLNPAFDQILNFISEIEKFSTFSSGNKEISTNDPGLNISENSENKGFN